MQWRKQWHERKSDTHCHHAGPWKGPFPLPSRMTFSLLPSVVPRVVLYMRVKFEDTIEFTYEETEETEAWKAQERVRRANRCTCAARNHTQDGLTSCFERSDRSHEGQVPILWDNGEKNWQWDEMTRPMVLEVCSESLFQYTIECQVDDTWGLIIVIDNR